MRYETITIPGEATDLLVVDFATNSGTLPSNPAWTPTIYGVWLSAQGPTFDWTLFFATAAAEGDAQDIPIEDSLGAIPPSIVDPTATSGEVINRSMVCPEGKPVPRDTVANAPMQLRVSTFNKTTPGTIRVAWEWKKLP